MLTVDPSDVRESHLNSPFVIRTVTQIEGATPASAEARHPSGSSIAPVRPRILGPDRGAGRSSACARSRAPVREPSLRRSGGRRVNAEPLSGTRFIKQVLPRSIEQLARDDVITFTLGNEHR